MKLLIVFTLFVICFLVYHVWKYRNPYKLYMYVGKKGAGKSTTIMKKVLYYTKKGRPCYSTTPIPGAYYFDPQKLGINEIEPGAVIFVDEVGMIWDNRNFKGFKEHTRDYFKLQRHYRHTVYLFSQSWDTDKKLRDLTDCLYLIRNVCNCFSVARKINKNPCLVEAKDSSQGEGYLADNLQFDSLLFFWCGAIEFTYIPKYAKYFDSYEVPQLKPAKYQLIPMPTFPTFKERLYNLPYRLETLAACARDVLRTRVHAIMKRLRWKIKR